MLLIQRNDIISREIDDEILLMDNQTMKVHQLNRTASYIWSRCNGSTSTEDITEQLARDFEVENHVAEKHVKDVLAQLLELKVLTPV